MMSMRDLMIRYIMTFRSTQSTGDDSEVACQALNSDSALSDVNLTAKKKLSVGCKNSITTLLNDNNSNALTPVSDSAVTLSAKSVFNKMSIKKM